MRFPRIISCLAILAGLMARPVVAANVKLHIEAVDPLVKIFRDDAVHGNTEGYQESARGEHATFQVVVTSSPVDIKNLQCHITRFRLVDSRENLPKAQVRYVGYVGSSCTAKKPASDQLRTAPAMFPDPLLEVKSVDVERGNNQSCWISVDIPVDAEPGDYRATSTVTASVFGSPTTSSILLKLKVYHATVRKTRLNVTNWFQMDSRGDLPAPKRYTPEWWDMMRLYVKDMVAHRQNWARVETLWIIKYSWSDSGKLMLDFTNFDKWVEILLDGGIEKIEGLQYAWRGGKWTEPYVVEVHKPGEKDRHGRKVPVDSPEAKKFYSRFFPALHAHLKKKGWLDKFVQHVGDEPLEQNAKSYIAAADLLKKYAPGIPIMEACLSHNMVGAIDIWVPILGELDKNHKFFQERQESGDKVWFYTCVQPQGNYANRFVELPLIKTRLLAWIDYRYNLSGYLHWGYNFWRAHPWDNCASGSSLPGGDPAIVYPAKHGYGIIGSIRWEAQRDGIEDHELLSQLGEKHPEEAMKLAKSVIRGFDKYNTDVKAFRATRHTLLEALKGK